VSLLTLFAGPNGSGKSTLIARSTFEGKERILDADAIARRMNASNPAAKYYQLQGSDPAHRHGQGI